MSARRLAGALALCAVLLSAPAARADRLHLDSGGTIDTDHWSIDGETLLIESPEGTIRLPARSLVSVERTPTLVAPGPKAAERPPAASTPTPRGPSRTDPEAARLMKEGNEALGARDFEIAVQRFYAVMQAVPEEPGPRVGYAAAEMALGRDAMALPVVLDGLVRKPGDPRLNEILGDLRNREERVEDALAAWNESFRADANDRVRDKIEKAERELAAGRDYRFTAAPHFNVKYDGSVDQDLVSAISDFLEDAYTELTEAFHEAPGQPITVLLYPQQAFRDVTRLGPEVAGLFDGKIRVPLAGLKTLDRDARRVLKHELTHAVVHAKTRGACPRWLQEGLAQVEEPRTLRSADAAHLASTVRADDPATWADQAFSYPAALSFTRSLIANRGFEAVVAVLGHLGEGMTMDASLEAVYGEDYEQLARRWADSLREGGSE